MPVRFHLAPLALAALLAAGCSGNSGETGAPPDPCESMASTCVAKQQGCVADGDTARCEACATGQYASLAGKCEPIGGTATAHEFAEFTTKPGEEVLGLCQSWTPFHLTYDGLHIPPHASSRFTGNCAVGSNFPADVLKMKLYYILPHTHAMASRFFVDVLGGPDDGKNLIEVKGFASEAHGLAYDPPIDMSKADGFSFGCEYVNQRSEYVDWGFGDQEMCELLGFADSTMGFESRVGEANPDGTDGEMQLFTGNCNTLAFAWDHNKPGGPGPN